LTTNDLIYPLFAIPGEDCKKLNCLGGVVSVVGRQNREETRGVYDPRIILFGIPEDKDSEATGAWYDCGIVQKLPLL